MREYIKIFISSILAGFCITIGATVFLFCMNQGLGLKIVGALLFCIGLFTIIHFKFWLYTGKVGVTLDNKPKFLIDLVVCLLGNLLGVVLLASVIKLTRAGEFLQSVSTPIVTVKENDNLLSIFILSILCGVMIYLAVKGHEKSNYSFGKVLFAFLPIVAFILCGYEHVVANAVYYTYAGIFSAKTILLFLIMAIGNGVGAILLDLLIKVVNKLDQKEENN